ncbi:MAG: hypothetical protein CVT60_02465 [Actinobacteria bacterium HGW-Actinobacteria-10]|nr:MAG: hypothetical protein CVT60_02465 [Actinobacteria bacterium HGW-Actinobacteria-10]
MALTLGVVLTLSLVGCGGSQETADNGPEPSERTEVILSSTTSTEDSGLFGVLIPAFEEANPEYAVKVIAVGTGEALENGRNRDADVLLVHAKTDEEQFVEDGYGVERKDVMYNDFVIVGPASDPAGVKTASDLAAAMSAISAARAPFVSRGDDSGTHKKELKLWKAADIATPTPDAQDWYESAGQGMGEVLTIASNKGAYTIADRATYLSMRESLDLTTVREGDKDLLNQYGVIVVAEAANQEGGQAFFDWVLSLEGQKVIEEYGVEEYGEPLFIPNAE